MELLLMEKVIEKMLPLRALSASATADKAKKAHPGNMHLWWNRSPVSSSSAVLLAGISDDVNQELIASVAKDEKDAIRKAVKILKAEPPELPTIVDYFSGFGGLTVAAQQLGLPVVSGDLNSVASVLTKAASEIPGKFKDMNPIHPDAQAGLFSGVTGLAEDINYYGKRLKADVELILENLYPKEEGEIVFSWIWVRSIECSNPACKCRVPLSSSYVLSRKKDNAYWAEPITAEGKTLFIIHNGECPLEKESNKIGASGAKFTCPACKSLITDSYVKQAGKEGKLGIQMMAVAVDGKSGRDFYAPSEMQIKAAEVLVSSDLPQGELPHNTRWFSTPGFGLTKYKDLYTPRQLKLLMTICETINQYRKNIEQDALTAGMSSDQISLKLGGNGAKAYSEAVSVYLTFLVDKLANYHSTVCTLDNRKGNIRAAFTRQAIPMTWTFAEANPFSKATGNFDTMLKNIVESVQNLPCGSKVEVRQEDATQMVFPANSILFTEMPYLDNVGYADLSDYFYIWMRRCLKDVYPELFEKIVTSKEELCSIPEHYGGDAAEAKKKYYEGIKQFFTHFYPSAAEEYPSLLFYELSRSDIQAIKSNEQQKENSTWEMLLEIMRECGFRVTAVWPVRTEKPNVRYESTRVLLVFRKMTLDAEQITRRTWINTLKREIQNRLDSLLEEDIDDTDRMISAMGFGLSIFMRYKKIINANGTSMSIHDALQLVDSEVTDYFTENSRMDANDSNLKED